MRSPIGLSDLLHSERGVFCILTLLVASALVLAGKLTGEAWLDLIKYLVGFLVAGKTVTTAVRTLKNKPSQVPDDLPEARIKE